MAQDARDAKTCPHIPTCEIFPMFQQPVLRIWQIHYCESDYSRCARFQASCASYPVPKNLLPNGKLLDLKATKE
jgi:hypothetical protein